MQTNVRDSRLGMLTLALSITSLCAMPIANAQSAAQPAPEKMTMLPVQRVSLYKNGIGFFEQSGHVSGDELVQIDFTTAQLNDALQSLTAVDLGGGTISGAGYDSPAPLRQQLDSLGLRLGNDPTVLDFFHAIKGSRVEVHSKAGVVTGRLLNVEVRNRPATRTDPGGEQRFITVIGDAGGIRTMELTPSVEVRLVDTAVHQEVGRYLQLLSPTHEQPTSLRHLTLEDRGTGDRELHVSYISAMPVWKSSYRILFSTGASAPEGDTATLQGWAVVDNTTGTDWDNVQLTLVSGAPQSFIQQISKPYSVYRPEIGIQGQSMNDAQRYHAIGAAWEPISANESASVPITANAIGGGAGIQISRAKTPPVPTAQPAGQVSAVKDKDYEADAEKSIAPQTTSTDMDDLVEYKLSKPISIPRGESALVPVLQTPIEAKRVTVWNPHHSTTTRALWLKNTTSLTLDQGSFSITGNGMFDGQGQIDVLHPSERRLVPYGTDEAVKVTLDREYKDYPELVRRIEVVNSTGIVYIHRRIFDEHDYTVQNSGQTARTVIVEQVPLQNSLLADNTPVVERTEKLDRFQVEVAANSTAHLKVLESHANPRHYELAKMNVADWQDVIKSSRNDPGTVAKLQPIIDAKRKLALLDTQMKANQASINDVSVEENRLRQNIASLDGNNAERSLSKRYGKEMSAQEDKLAALRSQKDSLDQQKVATEKDLTDRVQSLQLNIDIPQPAEDCTSASSVWRNAAGAISYCVGN